MPYTLNDLAGDIKDVIANNKISRPSVKNGNMYLVKDNSIIKLN